MTKTIFLLDIGNYLPQVKRLTLPFIRHYAERIGADIYTITDRKFPAWPVTYEKLQIHELAALIGSDWNMYLDVDALIHPECPDFSLYLPMGTVAFHSADVSHIRFRPDSYTLRDGRFIAPGNWFTVASRLCLDLWRPLEMTPAEAIERITPTANEAAHSITAEHLVDDFALTHNIARFGLAFKSFQDIQKERGLILHGVNKEGQLFQSPEFLFHHYTLTADEKTAAIETRIDEWNVRHYL